MEDSELDDWFTEEREKLEEKVYLGLQGKNPIKAKEDFDKQYRALILEFQKKEQQIFDSRERNAKIQAPIRHAKERMSLFFKKIQSWLAAQKLAIKKWFFDRKIRKIVRDKSDL